MNFQNQVILFIVLFGLVAHTLTSHFACGECPTRQRNMVSHSTLCLQHASQR